MGARAMTTMTKYKRSHANRGKWLETAIENAAAVAAKRGEGALVKLATPYLLPKDGPGGTQRILRQRSTVDFVGVVAGVPVAFDAKAAESEYVAVKRLQDHQAQFLIDFKRAGGIGAVLIAFGVGRAYLADVAWWMQWAVGGRKRLHSPDFRDAAADLDLVVPVPAGSRGYALDWPGAVVALAALQERGSARLGGASCLRP